MSLQSLVRIAVARPKATVVLSLVSTLLIVLAAALPNFITTPIPLLPKINVDVDPENMLPADEAVRVLHGELKERFALHELIVVGVVNEHSEDGVFTPKTLANIKALSDYAKSITLDDPEHKGLPSGVISDEVISLAAIDSIDQDGPGQIRFSHLMSELPKTVEDARALRAKVVRVPFYRGTVVSEDGKATALYIPIARKDQSHKIASLLQEKIASLHPEETYHITGLPVANDTFGVEMFVQMAVSAPIAMLVIFGLLWVFFRKLRLIVAPMALAMLTVMLTMGLLILCGNTIHIMSSMIPIFLMPIAVLDSVHILSDFYERFPETRDRRKTIETVMRELFAPMLLTSLTTFAGFLSLALTSIPPVQVFGIFVALGVAIAWILTMTFVPAYIMLIPERSFEGFGAKTKGTEEHLKKRWQQVLGRFSFARARTVVVAFVLLSALAAWGISRISINDNPMYWFESGHPIRVADRALNAHFGGTYMTYLNVEGGEARHSVGSLAKAFASGANALASRNGDLPGNAVAVASVANALDFKRIAPSPSAFIDHVRAEVERASTEAPPAYLDAFSEVKDMIDRASLPVPRFKDPEVLSYLDSLQAALLLSGTVGKVTSIVDIAKTLNRELNGGSAEFYILPKTSEAIAQALLLFQSSHRPNDLWHFTTRDFGSANLWMQLKSGNNKDMSAVTSWLEQYVAQNPPPEGLAFRWFGLPYINVHWQDRMVSGMAQALLGSFVVVFLMMVFLFRSVTVGFISMLPLSATIAFVYGAIGLVGKEYDMPIAVLSSLTLGLAVDFAIHFLVRGKAIVAEHGSLEGALPVLFEEPATAIVRNAIIVSVGFLPLLAAPLMPYKTVGAFLALILGISSIATLVLLTAVSKLLEKQVFAVPQRRPGFIPYSWPAFLCIALSVFAVVILNTSQLLHYGTREYAIAGGASLIGAWMLAKFFPPAKSAT